MIWLTGNSLKPKFKKILTNIPKRTSETSETLINIVTGKTEEDHQNQFDLHKQELRKLLKRLLEKHNL